jgi:hypothetical protein
MDNAKFAIKVTLKKLDFEKGDIKGKVEWIIDGTEADRMKIEEAINEAFDKLIPKIPCPMHPLCKGDKK